MLKIIKYILIALLSISVLIFGMYFLSYVGEGILIGWAYILFALCLVTSVVFPIIFLATNIKKAKGAIIGVAGLGLVLIISYILADSSIPSFMGSESFEISESVSKNISVGLWTMYILGGLTVLSLLYSEVSKMFK